MNMPGLEKMINLENRTGCVLASWHSGKKITALDKKEYCKSLNICGSKFSRFVGNDILAHFNFGSHDMPLLQRIKKLRCNL